MIVLVVVLYIVISKSFTQLLTPTNDLNTRTLAEITNTYKEDNTLKGNIYDRNGIPLVANIVYENGEPVMNDGNYQLVSDLDRQAKKSIEYRRMLLNESVPGSFSNILAVQSGGLDGELDDILQGMPLNSEDSTDVVLTIDRKVQTDVYLIMDAGRTISNAVVMDCHSGDVISMVSAPSYDYNAYRNNAIPFTSYIGANESFRNNVDNSHDCVQDYYKKWKSAWENDNLERQNTSEWKAGSRVEAWEKTMKNKLLCFDEESAQEQIDYWNTNYGTHLDLNDCIHVDFENIYQQEQAFREDEQNDGKVFPFPAEPEQLGTGEVYIPFFTIDNNNNEKIYLKLCYGNNNFIYKDCETYGFDPNFSFENCNLTNSAPGSCFKILMTALLMDKVSPSLMTDGEVNIGNVYCATPPDYLPTVETSRRDHATLKQALINSSNQYFSMVAITLDRLLHLESDRFMVSLNTLSKMDQESANRSGAVLQNYYESKFNVNTPIDAYFSVPEGKILSSLNKMQYGDRPGEDDHIYDDTLWYSLDKNGEVTGAFTDNQYSMMKKIGDTAYGQGYDRISPMFMAMSIGKCLTGKMYVPNVIAEDVEPRSFGEDFDRGMQTVSMMSDHLKAVYDAHPGYVPEDLSFSENAFSFYSKTGTSSADKGIGTQSTYGLFADVAGYPVQDGNKYQIIWYVGAVSDGTHCYAVVLRSYFDNDSYSLKKEFLQIVDSLYKNGYLMI